MIRVKDADEAFAVNNDVKYGLSSSVYTRDVNVAFRALNELDNGITYINAPTIGAEAHLPFGGVKTDGERAPRGRVGGVRVLLGDQGGVRGLLGRAAARADRQLLSRLAGGASGGGHGPLLASRTRVH